MILFAYCFGFMSGMIRERCKQFEKNLHNIKKYCIFTYKLTILKIEIMATRAETKSGKSLGMRFAGRNGATMHLTNQELELLFSMDENEKLDGEAWGLTAGQWLDMWKETNKADLQDMKNWGMKSLDDSLGWKSETKLGLDKNGQLCKLTKFTR